MIFSLCCGVVESFVQTGDELQTATIWVCAEQKQS